jgi:hypothetical protein
MTSIKLKLNRNNDDYETPQEGWEIILKYISKDKVIWLPFYCKGLAGDILTKLGYSVIHEDKDFFTYEPEQYDMIIDNPPYSIKKEVIEQCKKLGKPFALFLPLDTLERKYFKELLSDKIQIIIPEKRIHCMKDETKTNAPYKTCWFCYNMNLLDGRQLIFC